MSASRVGLAITIAGVAGFLFAYPAGRVVDRLGPKRIWAASTFCRAACFCVLPFVGSFSDYVLLAVVFSAFDSLGGASHDAYVIDVLPRKERVETQAYMCSSLNVGFTLGAVIGGAALATGSLTVIRWTPPFTALLMVANAVWIGRLPAAPHDLRVASGERRERPTGPGPLRNRGWLLVTFFTGTLWTNQVLLNIVPRCGWSRPPTLPTCCWRGCSARTPCCASSSRPTPPRACTAEVSGALGSRWAPALYTFLAMSWAAEGWLVIAGIVIVATLGLGPSVRMAERFRDEHFPVEPESYEREAQPVS